MIARLSAGPARAQVIPLGDWATHVVDFVTTTFGGVFDVIRVVFTGMYDGVDWALQTPPFWGVVLIVAILAVWLRGWVFGAGTVVGLLLIAVSLFMHRGLWGVGESLWQRVAGKRGPANGKNGERGKLDTQGDPT